jgi:hypothetical protein
VPKRKKDGKELKSNEMGSGNPAGSEPTRGERTGKRAELHRNGANRSRALIFVKL